MDKDHQALWGMVATLCGSSGVLASLVLFPLLHLAPEPLNIALFFAWLIVAFGGGVMGIGIGSTTLAASARWGRGGIVSGMVASLLLLLVLLAPMVA